MEAGADAPEPCLGTAAVLPAFFRTEWNVPEMERRNIREAGGEGCWWRGGGLNSAKELLHGTPDTQ